MCEKILLDGTVPLHDRSRCVSDLFTRSILVRDLAVSGSVAVILVLPRFK